MKVILLHVHKLDFFVCLMFLDNGVFLPVGIFRNVVQVAQVLRLRREVTAKQGTQQLVTEIITIMGFKS